MQWHPHGCYTMASKWGLDQERKRRGGREGEGRKRKERRKDIWEAASSPCCRYEGWMLNGWQTPWLTLLVTRPNMPSRSLCFSAGCRDKHTSLFLASSSLSLLHHSFIFLIYCYPFIHLPTNPLSSGEWKEGERDEGMRRGKLPCPVYLPLPNVQNPAHLFNKSLWIYHFMCCMYLNIK